MGLKHTLHILRPRVKTLIKSKRLSQQRNFQNPKTRLWISFIFDKVKISFRLPGDAEVPSFSWLFTSAAFFSLEGKVDTLQQWLLTFVGIKCSLCVCGIWMCISSKGNFVLYTVMQAACVRAKWWCAWQSTNARQAYYSHVGLCS